MLTEKPIILVIDDSYEDRFFLKQYLEPEYSVWEAHTGARGIELMHEAQPCCILLDFMLPDVIGLELLQLILQNKDLECAVVMLTGFGDAQLAVAALQAGAQDYLEKSRMTAAMVKKAVGNAIEKNQLQKRLYRKRQQLSYQRQIFSATLDAISNGILATDGLGQITVVNATLAAMTGWSADEVIGKPVFDVLQLSNEAPGEDWRSLLKNIFLDVDQQPVHSTQTGKLLTETGDYIPIVYTLTSKFTEAGTCVVFAIQDMRQFLSLATDRDLAEQSNRAKSQYLTDISHEIRTPLHAITGFTQLLLKSEINQQQEKYLIRIAGCANHLLQLIYDILDISKIEAGQMTLDQENFRLDQLLSNVINIVFNSLEVKKLQFNLDMSNVPLTLVGDPRRLTQILINYMHNAVKYTESGAITLRSKLVAETTHDYLLRFEVQDTGIGIPAEYLTAIFEPFMKIDRSIPGNNGESGLGLSINRRLAYLMGGEVG